MILSKEQRNQLCQISAIASFYEGGSLKDIKFDSSFSTKALKIIKGIICFCGIVWLISKLFNVMCGVRALLDIRSVFG